MELKIIHLIATVLAVGRLTEIVTVERISAPLRKRWPLYIWTCQRCVSVWAGMICTAAYFWFPYVTWPLALSALYIIQAQLMMRVSRGVVQDEPGIKKLIVTVDLNGNINVRHTDFDLNGITTMLHRTAEVMQRQSRAS